MITKKLKQLRMSHMLTQKDISKVLQISPSGYSNWENGFAEPNLDAIRKICILFDITADELLEIERPSQRNEIKLQISDEIKEKMKY